jgi:hypothetical protein
VGEYLSWSTTRLSAKPWRLLIAFWLFYENIWLNVMPKEEGEEEIEEDEEECL